MTSRRLLQSCILFTLLVLSSSLSWADNALEVTSISGASNHEIGSATTTPVIYGGVVGSTATCAAGTGTSSVLCNNCLFVETACNEKRVYPSTKLKINFKVITDISGTIFVGLSDAGANPVAISSGVTTSGTATAGGTGYVEIDWGTLCQEVYSDSSCGDPGTIDETFTIYISVEASQNFADANTKKISLRILAPDSAFGDNSIFTSGDPEPSSGFEDFKATPGDEKIDITEPAYAYSCKTIFKKVRFFYYPTPVPVTPFDVTTYGLTSSFYADFSLDSSCNATGIWSITGLENGVTYALRPSMIDIANNNIFLLSKTQMEGVADCDDGDPEVQKANCPYIATPGEVVGLLPEDLNCFIATAAYGSSFSPIVKTLRAFRNQFLLTNNIGRELTKFYYEYGPYGARFISDKPFVRVMTRILLTPPWAFAWLSIHYGLAGAFLIIFSMLAGVIYGVRESRRGSM
ncbi:MAG: hypothetical protein KDD38_01570 [Bdellovibrionales bacterium]|nr:hypothetical protein [Bdellovibrionales bacterium]